MDLKYSSFWPLVVLHEKSAGYECLIPIRYPVKGFMHSIPFFIQISNQCKHFSDLVERPTGLPSQQLQSV